MRAQPEAVQRAAPGPVSARVGEDVAPARPLSGLSSNLLEDYVLQTSDISVRPVCVCVRLRACVPECMPCVCRVCARAFDFVLSVCVCVCVCV